jgi:hypothetical protein
MVVPCHLIQQEYVPVDGHVEETTQPVENSKHDAEGT